MSMLSYSRFEEEVLDIFNSAGIVAYRLGKHFTKRQMGYASGGSVQLDIIAKCGQTALVIEPTTQKTQLKQYVQKKVRNFNKVWSSPNGLGGALAQNPSHFGLTQADAQQFVGLSDYRHLIVGPYLEEENLALSGGRPQNTYVWDGETIVYFKTLVGAIEQYSLGEIANSLGIDVAQVANWAGTPGPVTCDAIKARSSAVFQSGVPADVYVFTIRPEDLLYLATVRRVEAPGEFAYQRLPKKSRLPKIQAYIESSEIKFLNNLIVTIPETAQFRGGKLHIPRMPYSCEIVDGQHRLYAYARVSTATRGQDRLIVTGIRFSLGASVQLRAVHLTNSLRECGRIFLNINGEQRKVSSTILNNVRAFLLKEDCKETHAIEVLSRLNKKARTKNAFALKTFHKGVRTVSLVRSHFSFHFDDPGNPRRGVGVIFQKYQHLIRRSASGNDYTAYYDAIARDIYDFLRRAIDGMNYPVDWPEKYGYSSFACNAGLLRSFRFFRDEDFYWDNRDRIDDIFSKLVESRSIPQIFSRLPLGGAGPKYFEKQIVRKANGIYRGRLRRRGWLS